MGDREGGRRGSRRWLIDLEGSRDWEGQRGMGDHRTVKEKSKDGMVAATQGSEKAWEALKEKAKVVSFLFSPSFIPSLLSIIFIFIFIFIFILLFIILSCYYICSCTAFIWYWVDLASHGLDLLAWPRLWRGTSESTNYKCICNGNIPHLTPRNLIFMDNWGKWKRGDRGVESGERRAESGEQRAESRERREVKGDRW